MDNTEQTTIKVIELLREGEVKAWLKEKTVLQEISRERKLNKKARKREKAEQFRVNRIIVR